MKDSNFKLGNIKLNLKSIIKENENKSGIDLIKKITISNKLIKNPKNNPLITQINKLESEYLNQKTNEIQEDFYRIEGHIGGDLKNNEDVFKAYIEYLEEKNEKIYHRRISERLRHKERKTSGVYVEEIKKFPPVSKEDTTQNQDGLIGFLDYFGDQDRLKRISNNNSSSSEYINKLEFEYLNLKAKGFKKSFENQDLSKLKTKEEIFKEYIEYLSIEIKELHIKINVDSKAIKKTWAGT